MFETLPNRKPNRSIGRLRRQPERRFWPKRMPEHCTFRTLARWFFLAFVLHSTAGEDWKTVRKRSSEVSIQLPLQALLRFTKIQKSTHRRFGHQNRVQVGLGAKRLLVDVIEHVFEEIPIFNWKRELKKCGGQQNRIMTANGLHRFTPVHTGSYSCNPWETNAVRRSFLVRAVRHYQSNTLWTAFGLGRSPLRPFGRSQRWQSMALQSLECPRRHNRLENFGVPDRIPGHRLHLLIGRMKSAR